MPFVSDEQRKAAFANMKGRGRGPRPPRQPSQPRPPTIPSGATADIIMQIIGDWIMSGGDPFVPMQSGPGIPGTSGGPVALTGGAIYGTAPSSWAIHEADEQTPSFGTTPGYGITLDTDITINEFQPAQTVWGYLYLALQGIDPMTGQVQPGPGAPGTLRDPLSLDMAHQLIDHEATAAAIAFHGNVAPTAGTPMHPDAYSDRPWWAQ